MAVRLTLTRTGGTIVLNDRLAQVYVDRGLARPFDAAGRHDYDQLAHELTVAELVDGVRDGNYVAARVVAAERRRDHPRRTLLNKIDPED